jgi:phosphatidylserine/phosphatidylglycerophosphate/cardiolipin synthase-like enzyme
MKVGRLTLAAGLLLATFTPCSADPTPVIHYAPAENLEHIDVALIDRAEREIDLAAYVLTDWPVIQALTRAADRGVKLRIYFTSMVHSLPIASQRRSSRSSPKRLPSRYAPSATMARRCT